MKIRNGFVSNSSSSSFMAVGIDYSSRDWKSLLNAIGAPIGSYDYYEDINKPLVDVGYGIYKVENSDIYLYGGYEFYFVGLNAEPLFNKDMKLSEIKKLFQKIVKETYDVEIDLSGIKLTYDEVSSE